MYHDHEGRQVKNLSESGALATGRIRMRLKPPSLTLRALTGLACPVLTGAVRGCPGMVRPVRQICLGGVRGRQALTEIVRGMRPNFVSGCPGLTRSSTPRGIVWRSDRANPGHSEPNGQSRTCRDRELRT